ncbi:uncharacterized protein LY89DRAFT_46694 [Mollisia scopiformis]|uniref:RGS domain-containing protein n=1 Tax=Mollisia scopiformis TaxID=149040 RepID=A0A194XF11_MOLSC|nr:uncharacterized protein LY89DRAFT_46694 [Mollisia scopiformis]KUJ18357.1 hypothetical protein LY89DRAFT_46694 [Mollisia scopiformis]
MSILFYRRPDYLNKPAGPINSTECARYVERAKNSERAIPNGLSFDEVINNKALPPCSLNDFMDYLIYVEYNAENLQFYLWYKDYTKRFNALPEKDKVLSKEWIPDTKAIPDLTKDGENTEKKKPKRDGSVANIMEAGYAAKEAIMFSEDEAPLSPKSPTFHKGHMSLATDGTTTPSLAGSSAPSDAELAAQAGLKWQPFTIQPMREEINRVMRHYITFSAPRELNLSHKDRALCLHALQHTTHPSALAPAVKIVEAALRGQSHPNFIRWSICNGNKPRVFFVRTMGILHTGFGFVIAIILTLSGVSRWWRILAAPMWFIGLSTLVAAYKGLCVILHHSHARCLRPWEQDLDSELGEERRDSFASTANRTVQMASRTGNYDDIDKGDDSSSSFRPSSFQFFGPKNSFDDASWVEKYQRKPLVRKVFDQQTWTQDETLRILQDKIVLGANLWAIILTVIFTIVFVALPKGNFY